VLAAQLNTLCETLQSITQISLHDGEPGYLGDNETEVDRQEPSWSTPAGGAMKALVTFEEVSGTFTHVGMWDADDNFVHSRILNVELPTPQDLKVLVEFSVGVKS
jgi:hypothetical protein